MYVKITFLFQASVHVQNEEFPEAKCLFGSTLRFLERQLDKLLEGIIIKAVYYNSVIAFKWKCIHKNIYVNNFTQSV